MILHGQLTLSYSVPVSIIWLRSQPARLHQIIILGNIGIHAELSGNECLLSVTVCILCSRFVPSVIGADAGNGIRVFVPDIGMFVAGLAIWLLCRSLVQKRPPEDMAQYNTDFEAEEQVGFICGDVQFPENSMIYVSEI